MTSPAVWFRYIPSQWTKIKQWYMENYNNTALNKIKISNDKINIV